VYPQMRRDRAQRPATQMTRDQWPVNHDFADRRVEHGAVSQHPGHRADGLAAPPGSGLWPGYGAGHLGGHDGPPAWHLTSHSETTALAGIRHEWPAIQGGGQTMP
jgi:hypothetical protein